MDSRTFELIRQSFLQGSIRGLAEHGSARNEITTQISHIFFYETKAYKIYRHNNHDFNKNFTNLANPRVRSRFYKNDFFWNRFFSPQVYLRLLGVRVISGNVSLSPITGKHNTPNDFVIEMNILDNKMNLFHQMMDHRALKPAVAQLVGEQIVKRVNSFPKRHWEIKTVKSHTADLLRRLDDLEAFMLFCGGTFTPALTHKTINTMRSYANRFSRDLEEVKKREYGVTLDCHTTNLFVVGKNLEMIDIYSPKKEWRAGSQLINIYRIGADIAILAGDDAYKSFMKGCLCAKPDISVRHEAFYLAYAALIKGPYLYNMAPNDKKNVAIAFEYKRFALSKLKEALSKIN